MCLVTAIDLLYVLCVSKGDSRFTIRAHDGITPYDLLMITLLDEIKSWRGGNPFSMLLIENKSSLYVSDGHCRCIWKIDLNKNEVVEWLSRLGEEICMSVSNDDNLIVLKRLEDSLHLVIYDQDAKLVRTVSLPNNFRTPFFGIQKPNGEFIASHRLKEISGRFVSFLSTDGHLINQFSLKDEVGFEDTQLFDVCNIENVLAAERFSGVVYTFDRITYSWNVTDFSTIISNSSDEGIRKIVGFRHIDGSIFDDIIALQCQDVQLLWDTDSRSLFVVEQIFGNLYLLQTKTLKWSQIRRRMHYRFAFDTKRKQITYISCHRVVEILALTKY